MNNVLNSRKIYILEYNNIGNNREKGFSTIAQYDQYVVTAIDNINWNPGDGVDAVQILNTDVTTGDYLIVTNIVNGAEVIESRWFILECDRTRAGQYRFSLHRDVVYDSWEIFKNCNCYINKGYISTNNVGIYNKENVTLNQIKKNETLLKDATGTPWIVGYVNNIDQDITVTADATENVIEVNQATYEKILQATGTAAYDYSGIRGIRYRIPSGYRENPGALFYLNNGSYSCSDLTPASMPDLPASIDGVAKATYEPKWYPYGGERGTSVIGSYIYDELLLSYGTYQGIIDFHAQGAKGLHDLTINCDYADIRQYNNRIIKYNDTSWYVTIRSQGNWEFTKWGLYQSSPSLLKQLAVEINAGISDAYVAGHISQGDLISLNRTPYQLYYQLPAYIVELTNYVPTGTRVTIPAGTNKRYLQDQPYAAFCMPYNNFAAYRSGSSLTLSGGTNRTVAAAISRVLSGSKTLIDLQLLPYCPLSTEYIDAANHRINMNNMDSDEYTRIITGEDPGTTIGYLFWIKNSNTTFNISYSRQVPNDAYDFKVKHQSEFLRLNSPNYSSTFEFSATANGGITKFNVDMTIKPYSPYIHINPDFGELYGSDFDDARGLICAGDFSLPQVTDAWETYQIQNKNYQNSFNRQIQSQELQNKYALVGDIAGAITGTVGAATVGGTAGGVVGAVAGGVASGIAGAADAYINNKLRQEQLSLSKDQFNYNIGNIKALPDTLSTVGTLNKNNKLWPFVEVWDCTDQEKDIFRNILRTQGMTINQIGKPADFIQTGNNWTFIRGDIITIDDLHDDYHFLSVLKDKFKAGFFVNLNLV